MRGQLSATQREPSCGPCWHLNLWGINFSCWSHPIYSILLWQTEKSNTSMQSNNVFDYIFCCFNMVSFHSPFSHYSVSGCAIRHSLSKPRFNYPFPYCWIFGLFLIFKAVMNILEHIGFFPPLLGYFLGTNAFLEVEILGQNLWTLLWPLKHVAKLLLKKYSSRIHWRLC